MGLEIINKLRKDKGFTSEELAKKSGVPKGTLDKILNGQTKDPKLETIKSLANVLECSLDDFDNGKTSISLFGEDEHLLIQKYRQLNEAGRKAILASINGFLSNLEYVKTESSNNKSHK